MNEPAFEFGATKTRSAFGKHPNPVVKFAALLLRIGEVAIRWLMDWVRAFL
jgi:hypothetical protein